MDFALSEEQEALASAERSWLTRHDPIAERRPSIDDTPATISPSGLAHLADSGLLGLLTPDAGGTHVDLAVLVEEHGRACSPAPLAELALAARLLGDLGHPLAEAAANGEKLVTLTAASVENPALRADKVGDSLRITGATAPTSAIPDVDYVLLVVETESGDEVAAVVPADRLTTRTLDTLDVTRSWSSIEVDLDLGKDEWSPLAAGSVGLIQDQLAMFRAMDALGSAARLVDMTVSYAGQREQFGQPIGSFQAVKHHCADMALTIEASRAALWSAAVALDGDDSSGRERAVSSAAAYACDRLGATAQIALQVHGGIGFTWEHDVHLLIRRIKVDELLNGSVSYHRRRLALA